MPRALLSRLFRPRTTVIQSPRLELLNLKGPAAAHLVEHDRAVLAPLFPSPPAGSACDVLFLYADIDPTGGLIGAPSGLRELIRDRGAKVVVIASENPPEHSIAAGRPTGYGRANLVLTLARKDPAFTRFFSALFRDMLTGTSMPVAWVKLAPQIPGGSHADCPDTVFAAELGQLAFA
jgi:hypothetical protein